LFDIAQGALMFATPGERSMSPAERLAQSFTPVLGNIGTRAGELQKFKQSQAEQDRALRLQALGSAEQTLAARRAAEADLAKQDLIGAQDLAKLTLASKLDTKRGLVLESKRQEGGITLENVKQANRVALEETIQDNKKAIEKLRQSGRQSDLVLADKLQKESIQIRHDLELSKLGVANEYELKKIDKLHEQTKALQDSRLKLQEAIAKNKLDFEKAQAELSNAREDDRVEIQKKLADIKARDARLKESASKIDTFGKSLPGKVKNLLEGEGSAKLAELYGSNQTSPDETNKIEGAIGYYTNSQKVWNEEEKRYDNVAPNRLIDAWADAVKKRAAIEGASRPPLGQKEIERLGLVDRSSDGATAVAGTGATSAAADAAASSDETPIKGATFDQLLAELGSAGATEDLTGRLAFAQAILNRGTEVAFGMPGFPEAQKMQDFVEMLNTTSTAAIMAALPERQSEEFRKKIENILPPVGQFTLGNKTALDKTRGYVAYLNKQISSLNENLDKSPQAEGTVGPLRQIAANLAAYRDVYNTLADMLEATLAPSSATSKRKPIGSFLKSPGN